MLIDLMCLCFDCGESQFSDSSCCDFLLIRDCWRYSHFLPDEHTLSCVAIVLIWGDLTGDPLNQCVVSCGGMWELEVLIEKVRCASVPVNLT